MFQLIFAVLWESIKKAFVFLYLPVVVGLLSGIVVTLLMGLGNGEWFDFIRSCGVAIFLLCVSVFLFNEWQKRKNPFEQEILDIVHVTLSNTDAGQASDNRTKTGARASKQSKRTVNVDSRSKVIGDHGATISITIASEKWADSDEA